MQTHKYRTITNELIKGEIITRYDHQSILIIQDRDGFLHVVEKTPASPVKARTK
ncbi:aldo/keto reductase [Enterococcus sp.]|uniref:aldo/keto reductase n=1 Tax=Enterococcus sp. TaxID=35783 RepID=UPI002898A9B5|nr:aldo/keto reductase [Enterococcus sp.]